MRAGVKLVWCLGAGDVMAAREYTIFDSGVGRCGIAWSRSGIIGVQLPLAREIETRKRLFALYPDALLSQILMASGYPLEIVEAARWQQANPGPKGDAAIKAVADKGWDVSVKSLVAFPDVLKQLNEHLDWTQKLGDALIGQQADVAASIQRLRD